MMLDIFSSFDPVTKPHLTHMPLSAWILVTLPVLLVLSLWSTPTRLIITVTILMQFIVSVTSQSKAIHSKSLVAIIAPLFLLIATTNLIGLMPYAFSLSSHMAFTLTLALPLWLATLISSSMYNTLSFTASFLPSGAPGWLNPFLLIIELISNLVRPLTLSFRLAANISTGHILLALLGAFLASAMIQTNLAPMITLILTKLGYSAFEVAIALMQAYIFSLLLGLYFNEHP